jgi:hypothetical protein
MPAHVADAHICIQGPTFFRTESKILLLVGGCVNEIIISD